MEHVRDGNKVTVSPKRDIVSICVPELRDKLFALVEGGTNEVMLDLTQVGIIDSAGLGLLIALHNTLEEDKGTLEVCNASENLVELFRIMRLDKHFTVR